MIMQFRDLERQYLQIKPAIDKAIQNVLMSGTFIGGTEVSKLEASLASYVGVRHCITCANGTDALQLALMAWGIGPGDAVIVPDFTFFSSGEVVSTLGATPVFAAVDKETFNLDPAEIDTAVDVAIKAGLQPKVIVAVDLFGLPADYDALKQKCKTYGLKILEDGAQGFGGTIEDKKACSFGDISTTSFFPAKPLGCYGDGGAIFTDNDEWDSLIRSYAVHGKGASKYDNIRIGMNSRLDSIQAAVLNVKLDVFASFELKSVQAKAKYYFEQLKETELSLPCESKVFDSSWAQYTVLLPETIDRNLLQKRLLEQSIPTMVYYARPMHEQLAFKNKSLATPKCTETKKLCENVLSLPIGPYMTEGEIETVSSELLKLIRNSFD